MDAKTVGRMSLQGISSSYTLLNPHFLQPGEPTFDAAGNMWLPLAGAQLNVDNALIEVTPVGRIQQYQLTYGIYPQDCVAGRDGAIWFVDSSNYKIGRFTKIGGVREYAVS